MKTFNYFFKALLGVFILSVTGCKQKPLCELPTEVTYTQTIAPLIEAKCFMCHSQEVYKRKASRTKIYNYATLKEMGLNGALLGAITHQKGFVAMPFRKNEKIDTCSIALIAKWVETGMKK